MTREEAQRRLREAADLLEQVPPDATVSLTSGTLLKALRGVFPCACGDREPIEKGYRWASTVDPCCYSMVKGGHYKNLVEIMVFALPAKEEAGR